MPGNNKTNKISRREFLKDAGVAVGGVALASSVLASCTTAATTTSPSNGSSSPTTPKTATTAPVATPSQVIKWRFQDVATAGQLHYDNRTKFCNRVKEASGGRLVITQYAAGGLVNTTEMFSSIQNGTIEMVAATASYWSGIIGPVGKMGWCIPYAYEQPRELDNFLQTTYKDIMREADAKFGVYFLGTQLISSYPIISSKPINSVADLAKLKIRCVGLTAYTIEAIGGRTVNVPATEIYTGLATGVFDGCSWGGPSQTEALGLRDVAKYYLQPPVAAVCYNEAIINNKAWEALPADLKAIVDIAWNSISWETYKEMETFDQTYLKDYVTKYGVTITHMSDADVATMRKAAQDVMDVQVSQQDANYGKRMVTALKADLQNLGYIK